MTENNTATANVSIWPTVGKFSLIIAACSFIYTLILYGTGMATSTGASLLSFVIFIILMVLAMRKYRSLNGGYMTFGTATVIGILISVAASAISSILNAIYLAFVDDTILGDMIEQTRLALEQSGISDEQIASMLKFYESFLFTPVGMLVTGILSGVIGGVIISLILAAILKNPPPITD